MITLHLGRLLQDNGFGTLSVTGKETNPVIFWEGITLDNGNESKNGIWIESRGFPLSRGSVETQAFDIYARYPNTITATKKLTDILKYLKEAYGTVCKLPVVPGASTTEYKNVSIQPTNNLENIGTDAEGRKVWAISGQISYKQ